MSELLADCDRAIEYGDLDFAGHGNGGAKGLNEVAQRGIKNNWWHAASVPNSVILKWKKELGVDIYNKDHLPAVKKLLNDRDWAYLRTGTGRV